MKTAGTSSWDSCARHRAAQAFWSGEISPELPIKQALARGRVSGANKESLILPGVFSDSLPLELLRHVDKEALSSESSVASRHTFGEVCLAARSPSVAVTQRETGDELVEDQNHLQRFFRLSRPLPQGHERSVSLV